MGRAALALTVLLGASCSDPEPAPAEPAYEWVVLYYLPYDNDLSRFADLILDDLQAGIDHDGVAIAAYVDRAGVGGSEHVSLTRNGRETTSIETESSADPATLAAFLSWAVRAHPARRYALFLLGHGGEIDHFALDQLPARDGARWMTFSSAAGVIRAWESERDTHLELLFLQQCGRGTAETYYQLRNAADVLVASQVAVSAPNAYYVDMGRLLSTYPDTTGERLARFAVGWERESMFYEYSVVRSAALDSLPAHIDHALEGVDGDGLEAFDSSRDGYVDLPRWITEMRVAQGLDTAPAEELESWIEEEVVLHRRLSERSDRELRRASGISVFVPPSLESLERHGALELYRRSQLDELHRERLGSPAPSSR